jgi:hypothetical protein
MYGAELAVSVVSDIFLLIFPIHLENKRNFKSRSQFEITASIVLYHYLKWNNPIPRRRQRPMHLAGAPRTQLGGLTICALAHCFNSAFAVRTFMRCLQ